MPYFNIVAKTSENRNNLSGCSIKFSWKALLTFLFVLARMLVQRKFTTDRYVVYKWSG